MPLIIIDKSKCKRFLEKFQKRNFLLTDIVTCPINCLIPLERAKILEGEMEAFERRFKLLNLSNTCAKVIILPSFTWKALQTNRYKKVWENLERLGFRIVKWRQAEKELQNLVIQLKMRNVL